VGPRAVLDAAVKGKVSAPAGTQTPDYPACSLALSYPGSIVVIITIIFIIIVIISVDELQNIFLSHDVL
jgi:uncharacterized membrane-anchored protein